MLDKFNLIVLSILGLAVLSLALMGLPTLVFDLIDIFRP